MGAAPVAAGPALKAQTVRQVVRTSVGGTGVQFWFTPGVHWPLGGQPAVPGTHVPGGGGVGV